jgi:hypothetical protein
MPYPDSEYPSILRGRDKRESQRLLAAAPELLATLKRRAERRDAFDDDEWQDVLRLIAKAEGRE